MKANLQFPRANFIGFQHIMNELDALSKHSNDTYPPHNVVRKSEDEISIEVAVAGFDKEELDITYNVGVLTVSGEHAHREREYIHRGVSTKKFAKSFRLSEHVVVNGADFQNGLLVIDLKLVLPENKRPRKIEIGYNGGHASELLTEENNTS